MKNVGGDRVKVTTLVGPDGDPHVYSPSPTDARKIAAAKIVFINGLGFEGWIDRLVRASGSKAAPVVATKGIKPRKQAAHGHSHGMATTTSIPTRGSRSRTRGSTSPISGPR